MFASEIAPATAVKMFDNITLNRIRPGIFLNAKAGSTLDAISEAEERIKGVNSIRRYTPSCDPADPFPEEDWGFLPSLKRD